MCNLRTVELANLVVLFGGRDLVDSFRARFYPMIDQEKVRGKGEAESYRFHAIDFVNEGERGPSE